MTADNHLFYSTTRGQMTFTEVILAIQDYIRQAPTPFEKKVWGQAPERSYKVIVGTDSDARSKTVLVTALIVQRVGNGAIYFLTKSNSRDFPTIRDRIFAETMNSITLAQEVRSRLRDVLRDDFFWESNEVHVDVGKNGPTRELIDSVSGMIRGYDFMPVIKPESFAAFSVADKHT